MPCGRINTPEFAEKILEDDKADLIVMARAQLADAHFCNKAKNCQVNQIRYCIGCNQGCYDYFCNSLYDPSIKHITCMRNHGLLELEEATDSLTMTSHPKKVVILGGGLVGFETAEFLASQGKKITILEMKEKALQDLVPLRQITAQFAMNKLPITIETNATVEKIEDNVVIASGKEYFYDDVIMAVGSKANDTNIYENLDIPTYVIGDCKKAGVALDAFKDTYYAVLDINKK